MRLNIGGRKFVTTAGTLTRNGTEDNYFARLLSGRMPLAHSSMEEGKPGQSVSEQQWVFIDRNGRYFEPILDFLRTGEWMVPRGMDERLVMREAEYYCIKLPRFGDLAVSNVAMHNQVRCRRHLHDECRMVRIDECRMQTSAYGAVLDKKPRLVKFLERVILESLTRENPSLEMPATQWISVWPPAVFVSAHRHPSVLGVEPQVKLTLKDIAYFDPKSVIDTSDVKIRDVDELEKLVESWEIPTLAAAIVWHMRERHRLSAIAEWASYQGEYQPTGLTPGYVRIGATAPLLRFQWCPPSGSSLWIPPPSLNLG